MRNVIVALAVIAAVLIAGPGAAQPPAPAGTVLDETIARGRNYDKAEFRLWLPNDLATVQAIALLVPGSNGDGRGQVDDPVWQAFAVKHRLALVGVRLTDKPHDLGFIEEYVNVSQGSGQAMLDAVSAFAARARHPELTTASFLLWGMSAGGEFNYEFVCWKPERVAERWQWLVTEKP